MNVVLYSTVDLSPITILDLPMWAIDLLENHCRVRLPITPRFVKPYRADQKYDLTIRSVEIWGEPLQRGAVRTMWLFTNAEEGALQLTPGYLTGQLADLQEKRRTSFMNGFLEALEAMR